MIGARSLRQWRENYYVSNVLAAVAQPLYDISRGLSLEIQKKVKKNSATIALPNGRTLRFARDAGVGIGSLLFWRGLDGFEPATSRTLRFFFERSATFVDVGANYGYYSLLGALWNPALGVVSFEPVPQIYEGLVRNIALNRIADRVTVYPIALSDRTGKATFYLPQGESKDYESTGTLVADGWQGRKHSPSFQVETMRFDDFRQSHPMNVDVVKIDVEDFEAGVLRGMVETIACDRPFIICEILPRGHKNQKTKEIVEQLGYTPEWIASVDSYVRVSSFDFRRSVSTDFLLSPVSVPGEIVTDLEPLWARRREGG
jgi:FkbM family methyltransferase